MTTYIHITTVHPHAYVIYVCTKSSITFRYLLFSNYLYTHFFSPTPALPYPTNHRRISYHIITTIVINYHTLNNSNLINDGVLPGKE